jgi:hypothetical protein
MFKKSAPHWLDKAPPIQLRGYDSITAITISGKIAANDNAAIDHQEIP